VPVSPAGGAPKGNGAFPMHAVSSKTIGVMPSFPGSIELTHLDAQIDGSDDCVMNLFAGGSPPQTPQMHCSATPVPFTPQSQKTCMLNQPGNVLVPASLMTACSGNFGAHISPERCLSPVSQNNTNNNKPGPTQQHSAGAPVSAAESVLARLSQILHNSVKLQTHSQENGLRCECSAFSTASGAVDPFGGAHDNNDCRTPALFSLGQSLSEGHSVSLNSTLSSMGSDFLVSEGSINEHFSIHSPHPSRTSSDFCNFIDASNSSCRGPGEFTRYQGLPIGSSTGLSSALEYPGLEPSSEGYGMLNTMTESAAAAEGVCPGQEGLGPWHLFDDASVEARPADRQTVQSMAKQEEYTALRKVQGYFY